MDIYGHTSEGKENIFLIVQCFLGFQELIKLNNSQFIMIISQVKIIVFRSIINLGLWILYVARKDCSLFNKQKIHGCLEIRDLRSRVEHDI